jgi:hypothetical protein
MANRIQLRRDTAGNWTSVNPILADGEMGVEWDTGFIKVGDGSTVWTSLDYNTVSKDIPQNDTNTPNPYVLSLQDRGKQVYNSNYSNSIIVPTNNAVAFPLGSTITIITNESYGGFVGSAETDTPRIIVPGVAYNTNGYDLPTASMAALIKVGTNTWYLSGYGITQD